MSQKHVFASDLRFHRLLSGIDKLVHSARSVTSVTTDAPSTPLTKSPWYSTTDYSNLYSLTHAFTQFSLEIHLLVLCHSSFLLSLKFWSETDWVGLDFIFLVTFWKLFSFSRRFLCRQLIVSPLYHQPKYSLSSVDIDWVQRKGFISNSS